MAMDLEGDRYRLVMSMRGGTKAVTRATKPSTHATSITDASSKSIGIVICGDSGLGIMCGTYTHDRDDVTHDYAPTDDKS